VGGNRWSEEERLTVSEAAKELGVSEKTTRSLIDRGELTAYRPVPRKTWILQSDLDAFLNSRKTSRDS
jgi:excisionase family DNA binding protein